jgi:hypothetical protein
MTVPRNCLSSSGTVTGSTRGRPCCRRGHAAPLVCKPAINVTIIATLNAISAKLTTAALLWMDNAIITQHADYATVAAGFLKAEGPG